MDFNAWKREVNLVIQEVIGFDADDLTDFAYRKAWEAGRQPVSVAYDVLVANGYSL